MRAKLGNETKIEAARTILSQIIPDLPPEVKIGLAAPYTFFTRLDVTETVSSTCSMPCATPVVESTELHLGGGARSKVTGLPVKEKSKLSPKLNVRWLRIKEKKVRTYMSCLFFI
jgi:hypothetical protein